MFEAHPNDHYGPDGFRRDTHLLSWLEDGYNHCQRGSAEWCQSYITNARDVIVGQDAQIATLTARVEAAEAVVREAKEALEPFARIADMEENAGPAASVFVNVARCRDARTTLARLATLEAKI